MIIYKYTNKQKELKDLESLFKKIRRIPLIGLTQFSPPGQK